MHELCNNFVTRSTKGFTLIELLIVIANMSMLTALGIGVSSRVKMVSERAKCASNLRQVGIALQSYSNDNGGDFPRTSHTTEGASLHPTLVTIRESDRHRVRGSVCS